MRLVDGCDGRGVKRTCELIAMVAAMCGHKVLFATRVLRLVHSTHTGAHTHPKRCAPGKHCAGEARPFPPCSSPLQRASFSPHRPSYLYDNVVSDRQLEFLDVFLYDGPVVPSVERDLGMLHIVTRNIDLAYIGHGGGACCCIIHGIEMT